MNPKKIGKSIRKIVREVVAFLTYLSDSYEKRGRYNARYDHGARYEDDELLLERYRRNNKEKE